MQSFFEQKGTKLDTTLPSVRHVQDLIRSHTIVRARMVGGEEVEGTIQWQDPHFLALRQPGDLPPVLLNREAIAVLRALV
jgi:host factor-I protein